MGIFDSFSVSASGLTAERLRLDVIAHNLANVNTTRTATGGPYRRRGVVFAERLRLAREAETPPRPQGAGVQVVAITEDPGPPRLAHDPSHPDADQNGYVAYPNINPVNEMVDMITATRAYEANATVLDAAKGMALKALEIGRG